MGEDDWRAPLYYKVPEDFKTPVEKHNVRRKVVTLNVSSINITIMILSVKPRIYRLRPKVFCSAYSTVASSEFEDCCKLEVGVSKSGGFMNN